MSNRAGSMIAEKKKSTVANDNSTDPSRGLQDPSIWPVSNSNW
jgi:hypothetical protein